MNTTLVIFGAVGTGMIGYNNPFPKDKGEKTETNSKSPKIEKQAGVSV